MVRAHASGDGACGDVGLDSLSSSKWFFVLTLQTFAPVLDPHSEIRAYNVSYCWPPFSLASTVTPANSPSAKVRLADYLDGGHCQEAAGEFLCYLSILLHECRTSFRPHAVSFRDCASYQELKCINKFDKH
jgi:hypothetical protein